ncbi:AraC family transcriptional regulator [Staphylococcus sp. ACRSN]|uniref:AraC family transcriptional regulator n=1 Tax=Staphylococcus sp. ACRSN TaxID=2918214 RepID=UPI001EF24E48|nr:AraC family transcriptional regulator [Staphylococcus sp. ACRSN]MCG7339618.1 AraC family transcriptional regulator [Staphylococcus sp. ACRSN]
MSHKDEMMLKLDTISLNQHGRYVAWHKISDGHFGNELHYHDHYELFFSLSGNMLYTIGDCTYKLDVGSLLIIEPFEFHKLNEQLDGHAERIGLRFNSEILNELSTEGFDLGQCFDMTSSHFKRLLQLSEVQKRELHYIWQGLLKEQDHNYIGKPLNENALLTQFFVILNRVAEDNRMMDPHQYYGSELVRQILDYMEMNFSKPISLEDLENKFYVSRYKITEQFTKLVGYPPYKYLLQKRLQHAQYLLENGENPQQVASLCGFTDYSNFYRRFKTTYGCSPRNYLNNHSRP